MVTVNIPREQPISPVATDGVTAAVPSSKELINKASSFELYRIR
jgi:hypothetical protein